MIKLQDLNPHGFPTTPEIDDNLKDLLVKVNDIMTIYGKAFTITSGLRSRDFQDNLIKAGKSNAPHSKHLTGEAIDISDPAGVFHKWCKENEKVLETLGFWCEERQGGWQHLQIIPPHSGHRWFFP